MNIFPLNEKYQNRKACVQNVDRKTDVRMQKLAKAFIKNRDRVSAETRFDVYGA